MTNGEIRQEGWRLLRHEGWMIRLLYATVLFALIASVFSYFLSVVYEKLGAVDFQQFASNQIAALAANRQPEQLTSELASAMILPSVFTKLKDLLLAGICAFGFRRLYLRAVRGAGKTPDEPWSAGMLGGLRDPAGMLWLALRLSVQTFLWTLLFVVPGIVAAYRYSQAWLLKADHPEWSAGECLAESGRLMDGRKMDLFRLHASYWRIITLFLLAFLVALIGITASAYAYLSSGGGSAEAIEAALGPFAPLVGLALPSMIAALVLRLLVRWSLSMGNALFYRELMKPSPADAELVPDGGEETSLPE